MEILKQFSGLSKAERTGWVQTIIEQISEGEINPLAIHTQVKCLEDMLKELTNNETYRSHCLDEAGKHGKSFELYNAKFSIREVGVKYDYSKCDDPLLNELESKLEDITAQVKQRQKFLQAVPMAGLPLMDKETGEVYTVYPPARSSTTSITVTLQ